MGRTFRLPILAAVFALTAVTFSASAGAQSADSAAQAVDTTVAQAINASQMEALGKRVAEFDTAILEGDFDTIIEAVPPKVLDAMAARFSITPEQMRSVFKVQAAQAMQQVEIVSFAMDVDAAEPGETPAGVPYVLIPTETVMELDSMGRAVARSKTVALLDGSAWYLVRVDDDSQITVLREAYPGFADVRFEPHTLDFVDR